MFTKRMKIEVVYWGEVVADLSEAAKMLNKYQIIPRIGDTVLLPQVIEGTKCPPDGPLVTAQIPRPASIGKVVHVIYCNISETVQVQVVPDFDTRENLSGEVNSIQ